MDLAYLEESSDEGWQEASTRGRSAHVRRKSGSKRPSLSKLVINIPETAGSRSTGNATRTSSPNIEVNITPTKSVSRDVYSGGELPKVVCMTGREESAKAPGSETKLEHYPRVSGTTRLSTVASKSVSYKEVAMSPPGTVLKPAQEQVEQAKNETVETAKIPECSDLLETTKDEALADVEESVHEEIPREKSSSSSSDEAQDSSSKKATTKPSKLSASAPPFNPSSLLSMAHPYSSVAVAGTYDARIPHQTVIPQPLEIPSPHSVDARVPRGPRSALYYRTGHSFRRKHGYPNCQNTVVVAKSSSNPSIMNPHAAEFVPGKAWQPAEKEEASDALEPSQCQKVEPEVVTKETRDPEKLTQARKIVDGGRSKEGKGKNNKQSLVKEELAKQILLKFIVKSVLDSSNEAKDEANTKSAEEESRTGKEPQGGDGSRTEVHKSKNQDTEGFTMVSKRKKSRHQLTNTVHSLDAQQPICTSVS
ncbi:protein TSS-like [Iris pallida]|uniref:Protein TSS-like n=1 Tax=Iris pallida TaxID=29817 RepID=A0AAX6GQB6_IRIPA|nr:protein TSS-like [Iris pallida]